MRAFFLIGNEAHAGHAGFGFLKLGDVYLDDVEASFPQAPGGARVACWKDQAIARSKAVGGAWLLGVDGHRFDARKL